MSHPLKDFEVAEINDKERLIYKIDEGAIYRHHYTAH